MAVESGRPRASAWTIREREARGHAVIVAGVLWVAAAALWLAGTGNADAFGRVKGADFSHFYTLGRAAADGASDLLYDRRGLHEFQTMLVPEAASQLFEPVYPPQTALMFSPLAGMPYLAALLVWTALTAGTYGTAIVVARRHWKSEVFDTTFLTAAALAFPPFWSLVLHGQTTAVPLLAFLLGWQALERHRRVLAGLALSLIALKPQFGLGLAAIVIATLDWRMLAGAVVGVAAQMLAAAWLLGMSTVTAYWGVVTQLPAMAEALEPRPYQLHSIKAVADLLPAPFGTALWLVVSLVVLAAAVRVWRSRAPLSVRFAVLVVATVLVSPHLTLYDATVLALPLVLLAGWLLSVDVAQEDRRRAFQLMYWLSAAYLIPVALVIRVQPSVFVLGWLFVLVTKRALSEPSPVAGR